jgi:hypothetical protein
MDDKKNKAALLTAFRFLIASTVKFSIIFGFVLK